MLFAACNSSVQRTELRQVGGGPTALGWCTFMEVYHDYCMIQLFFL